MPDYRAREAIVSGGAERASEVFVEETRAEAQAQVEGDSS